MDYGKKDPSLGWRFTDAWLSMAGNGDKGIPNGLPVDEWGIRMEGCRPVGSSVERGGDTNGPAAVYAIAKYVDWLKKYAPPNARGMTFSEAGAGAGAGQHRPADLLVHRLHRRHGQARPAGGERRRHAEMAHGTLAARLVLEGGHEARLPGRRLAGRCSSRRRSTAARRPGSMRSSCVAKTTSLKKSHVGLTFIRESDIWRQELHRAGAQARRPDRVLPLAGARAVDADGRQRARLSEAGAALVAEHRRRLVRREDAAGGDGRAGGRAGLGPRAPREARACRATAGPSSTRSSTAEYWFAKAEKRRRPSRRSASSPTRSRKGETVDYDTLIKSWPATPPKR